MKYFLIVALLQSVAGPLGEVQISWHSIASTFTSGKSCAGFAARMNQVSKKAHRNIPDALTHLPTPKWMCYSEEDYIEKFGRKQPLVEQSY